MEQAPQYSPKEKIRRIGAACVFLALAVAAVEWAMPVLEQWLACRHDGNVVMLYAVFAGYPSLLAAGLLALNGSMFYRVWRQRQYPPQGMKTYRPTPYVYGGKARLRAAGFFSDLRLFARHCRLCRCLCVRFYCRRRCPNLSSSVRNKGRTWNLIGFFIFC